MSLISKVIDKFYDFFSKETDRREDYPFKNYREAYREWKGEFEKIRQLNLPEEDSLFGNLLTAEYRFLINNLPPQDRERFKRALKKEGVEIVVE